MTGNKNTPHPHADIIKAWADGAEIQYYSDSSNKWLYTQCPSWDEYVKFRVKPVEDIHHVVRWVTVNGIGISHWDYYVGEAIAIIKYDIDVNSGKVTNFTSTPLI